MTTKNNKILMPFIQNVLAPLFYTLMKNNAKIP